MERQLLARDAFATEGVSRVGIEVQRTIKHAEMTAFWVHQPQIHTSNMGILSGSCIVDSRNALPEMQIYCVGPKAREAESWIKIGEV